VIAEAVAEQIKSELRKGGWYEHRAVDIAPVTPLPSEEATLSNVKASSPHPPSPFTTSL
jgi:hypothetical protein